MEILDRGFGEKYVLYSISLEPGAVVDVKVCTDTGLVYIMQNEDGSTVYCEAFSGYTFPNFKYDEEKVIQFVKDYESLLLKLKDASKIEYKGIVFDDWAADGNGIWANICQGCAEKHKDVLSADELDGCVGGVYCSVCGCCVNGLETENENHYYIDFNPELVHPLIATEK